jgi:hypothetical protein
MTAKKMLVVVLSRTGAVLGAATRSTPGVPAVGDLVGDGLVARRRNSEASVVIPPEDLEVKEVDYSDDVLHDPRAHVVDASGSVAAPAYRIASITSTNTGVTVTVDTGSPAVVAPDKTVLVVIDGGPNQGPLKFSGKTALNVAATLVPVSGVPPGIHMVLASVDGYASRLRAHTFS